jgi:hypothetical protein
MLVNRSVISPQKHQIWDLQGRVKLFHAISNVNMKFMPCVSEVI